MANDLPDVEGYETYLKLEIDHSFQIVPTTEEVVARIMASQKPKLSCCIDTINKKIEKLCAQELATPMTMIIEESIKEGCVPDAFKTAHIIPLYKKNAPDELGN